MLVNMYVVRIMQVTRVCLSVCLLCVYATRQCYVRYECYVMYVMYVRYIGMCVCVYLCNVFSACGVCVCMRCMCVSVFVWYVCMCVM